MHILDLHLLWFGLIAILFTGFFVLEGFDYGVGILLPWLGKNDTERRMILNSIGPFWDGNEVWLITAGGATFAAFPGWYATMFSTFYLEMFAILLALILRGAAIEFRSLHDNPRWRNGWDWAFFTGSLLPGFFWGVILANAIQGLPIDANMNYAGTIWQIFNPLALLCGITLVVVFTLHGAIFLSLRVNNHLIQRAQRTAKRMCIPALLLFLLIVGVGFQTTEVFHRLILDPRMVPFGYLTLATLVFTPWLLARGRSGWAFTMTIGTIILLAVTVGIGIFPHFMISSLNPAWSLTIDNTASSPYTLTVMSWIALTCIPFVLAYQAWNYWVFRKRISPKAIGHY
ncbi:cytochrome d ubiquinol oxidase subunit II [Tengunoibacter tsumagoiensis]|uniref:Cytochrome c oxidase assembly protein n=1 Tax=Tengunoibacter tsumagoiensis TaxID=2014871 RepID=A0A401ZVP4_9CHLR|nr:cytochrome d ubiquinol oxidase subunit II [Tengunoibacter tsumagoiensis]GCE10975.1 cytochrome c oxidase assembly protein [Tengunoibacter tsumagoiensis]